MEYIFKEKITYKQYEKFMSNQKYLSFMQEEKWAQVKNNNNHLIVAVIKNDEVCALAHILINKKIFGNQFFIPNGYIIDYTNIDLLKFMTENIKNLAKKKKAYVIDIYPNIITLNSKYKQITDNLQQLNYIYKNEYLDNSKNILIPLKINGKKIPQKTLYAKYENKSFYSKRGIYFEKTNNIQDVERMDYLINKDFFNTELVKRILECYKDRAYLLFAKIDLVFYKNYLEENNSKAFEYSKISELLQISDEIDVGCALVIEPLNKKENICEFLFNFEKESFESLDIMNGIIFEALKVCINKKFTYLKISNINLNTSQYLNRYNAKEINFIGHYSLVINKFKKILNTEIEISK